MKGVIERRTQCSSTRRAYLLIDIAIYLCEVVWGPDEDAYTDELTDIHLLHSELLNPIVKRNVSYEGFSHLAVILHLKS